MAFVAEDGTGLADSNSIVDVAYANAYFADRGVAAWVGADTVKQGWLVQATDYIELRFANYFLGTKLVAEQALSFPRVSDKFIQMPVSLKNACCEYALRAKVAKLLPDPVIDATGLGVLATRNKIGPIEKETKYQYQGPGTVTTLVRPYPAADALLRNLIKLPNSGVIRG